MLENISRPYFSSFYVCLSVHRTARVSSTHFHFVISLACLLIPLPTHFKAQSAIYEGKICAEMSLWGAHMVMIIVIGIYFFLFFLIFFNAWMPFRFNSHMLELLSWSYCCCFYFFNSLGVEHEIDHTRLPMAGEMLWEVHFVRVFFPACMCMHVVLSAFLVLNIWTYLRAHDRFYAWVSTGII